jgi:hypothetical protein
MTLDELPRPTWGADGSAAGDPTAPDGRATGRRICRRRGDRGLAVAGIGQSTDGFLPSRFVSRCFESISARSTFLSNMFSHIPEEYLNSTIVHAAAVRQIDLKLPAIVLPPKKLIDCFMEATRRKINHNSKHVANHSKHSNAKVT